MDKDGDHNAGEAGISSDGGSKAGLMLLGAALVLAAVSIGYNVAGSNSGEAEDPSEESPLLPPSVEELQARAKSNPDDALAWQELGFAHFQRGEFSEAVVAYERAVDADNSQAVLWSALAEARVRASDRDPLPADALSAFRKALELDPKDPRARYFLAVEKDLADDHEGAINAWIALLQDTPPGAPWEADLVRTIQQVGAINQIDVETRLAAALDGRTMATATAPGLGPTGRGPTQEQIAAAGAIPPSEQRSMAEGMVASLEERLKTDTGDLDGWVMLMRSRVQLGQPDRAKAALQAAIAANPEAESGLRATARQLGIR